MWVKWKSCAQFIPKSVIRKTSQTTHRYIHWNPSIDCQEENSYARKLCIDQRLGETKHEFWDICWFKFIMTKTPKTLRQWIRSDSIGWLYRTIDKNYEFDPNLSSRGRPLVLWVNPYESKEFLKIITISREGVVVIVGCISFCRVVGFISYT